MWGIFFLIPYGGGMLLRGGKHPKTPKNLKTLGGGMRLWGVSTLNYYVEEHNYVGRFFFNTLWGGMLLWGISTLKTLKP